MDLRFELAFSRTRLIGKIGFSNAMKRDVSDVQSRPKLSSELDVRIIDLFFVCQLGVMWLKRIEQCERR